MSSQKSREERIAEDAATRVAEATGLAVQLCYAPILFAIQDGLQNGMERRSESTRRFAALFIVGVLAIVGVVVVLHEGRVILSCHG